jgi:GNAT superfamily N-acetyltransferase
MEISLREPESEEELERYYDLRWRILRMPWLGERKNPRDQDEQTSTHLTAWEGNRILGCGRFYFNSSDEVQIRSMAVEHGCQKMGIGSVILKGIEQRARHAGARRIVLDAREGALEFYRKNQYQVGERSYTLYDSIAHWRMYKNL